MGKYFDKDIDLIKNDIKNICEVMTSELSFRAKEDLSHAANFIIDDFYWKYTSETHKPKYYVRTDNLRNALEEIFPYELSSGYVGGVSASSDRMFDNYNIDKGFVFELFWMQGHRGLPFQNLDDYIPSCELHGKQYSNDTPHLLMCEIVDKWGTDHGERYLKEIERRIM